MVVVEAVVVVMVICPGCKSASLRAFQREFLMLWCSQWRYAPRIRRDLEACPPGRFERASVEVGGGREV